jgi:hypothetical protein
VPTFTLTGRPPDVPDLEAETKAAEEQDRRRAKQERLEQEEEQDYRDLKDKYFENEDEEDDE